jgi:hypothetical protein
MHILFVERRSFDVDAFSISQHAHQGVDTCLEAMVIKGVHIDHKRALLGRVLLQRSQLYCQ